MEWNHTKKLRLSVVIPVYQAEAYLEEAVNSVRQQSYQDLEIILVDDGSTDGSGKLCDWLAEQDKRIRVIHQRNQGLTMAWMRGVEAAGGEYVGFVDSDDWIDADMYETMLAEAIRQEADLVCCGIRHVFEDHRHRDWDDEMKLPKSSYTKEEIQKELYPVLLNDGSFMGRSLQPNRVSKLVKRELILQQMHLCNDRVSVGEDVQFSFSLIPKVEKLVVLPHFLPYHYRVNAASMTGGYDRGYLDKIIYLKKQLERISKAHNVCDFTTQILNDFLCLVVLHIKSEIVRNKQAGYRENKANMKRIINDAQVQEALRNYKMPRLTPAERLFLIMMRGRLYLPIYLAVLIYFINDSM